MLGLPELLSQVPMLRVDATQVVPCGSGAAIAAEKRRVSERKIEASMAVFLTWSERVRECGE